MQKPNPSNEKPRPKGKQVKAKIFNFDQLSHAPYLRKYEAAALLRCSVQKINEMIAAGTFSTAKIGGIILLRGPEVMKFVEAEFSGGAK